MFENPRRGRQAKNFTTNVPKILDLKSSSSLCTAAPSLGAAVHRLIVFRTDIFPKIVVVCPCHLAFCSLMVDCKFLTKAGSLNYLSRTAKSDFDKFNIQYICHASTNSIPRNTRRDIDIRLF